MPRTVEDSTRIMKEDSDVIEIKRFMEGRDYDRMLEKLKSLNNVYVNSPTKAKIIAMYARTLASLLMDAKKYEEAINLYKEVVQLYPPDKTNASKNIAQCYENLADKEKNLEKKIGLLKKARMAWEDARFGLKNVKYSLVSKDEIDNNIERLTVDLADVYVKVANDIFNDARSSAEEDKHAKLYIKNAIREYANAGRYDKVKEIINNMNTYTSVPIMETLNYLMQFKGKDKLVSAVANDLADVAKKFYNSDKTFSDEYNKFVKQVTNENDKKMLNDVIVASGRTKEDDYIDEVNKYKNGPLDKEIDARLKWAAYRIYNGYEYAYVSITVNPLTKREDAYSGGKLNKKIEAALGAVSDVAFDQEIKKKIKNGEIKNDVEIYNLLKKRYTGHLNE
ncbi:hypothetical protein J7J90_03115 [Candidatus Micrarchaeota archaeon]|nr:hypothetical protein [Candidatus Micrarchaeota archaeon]